MRQIFLTVCFGFLLFAVSVPATADDLFTVKDVPVDASAAAAVDAQAIAINAGQRKAWTILYHRLTRQEDWPRQPQLDAASVQRLIRNFIVTDERRSTTRYVAKVTYVFNKAAVTHLLQSNAIAYIGGQDRQRVLLIPLSPGFAANSPWAQAWRDPRFATGLVRIVTPSGDSADGGVLGGLAFGTVSLADLSDLTARYHVADVVLAQLQPPAGGQLIVKLRRLGPGQPLPPSVTVPVAAGQSPAALPAAADAVAAAVTDTWKNGAAIDFSKSSDIAVNAQFKTIGDWVNIQKRLSGVDTIVGVDAVAFASNGARLGIAYVGGLDQLRRSLSAAGIALSSRDGVWWIASDQLQPGD